MNQPQAMPMMCEKKGCNQPATYDCEQIPGTECAGWENEPTARCDEHAKGLIIIKEVTYHKDPGGKYNW